MQASGTTYPLPTFLKSAERAAPVIVPLADVRASLSPMAFRLWRRLLIHAQPPACVYDLGSLAHAEREPLIRAARDELVRAGLIAVCDDFCTRYIVGHWPPNWRHLEDQQQPDAVPLPRVAATLLRKERQRKHTREKNSR
jgi:hypothetical protein